MVQTTIVLSGTRGELWLGRPDSLARKYATEESGGVVRPLALPAGQNYAFDGQNWLANGQLYYKIDNRFDRMRREWVRLTTYGNQTNFVYACFLPKEQTAQIMAYGTTMVTANAPDIQHGKGDFICCYPGQDGSPCFNDMWVINGLVFRDTYKNTGWQDCLVGPTLQLYQMSIDKLPTLSAGASAKQGILDEIE